MIYHLYVQIRKGKYYYDAARPVIFAKPNFAFFRNNHIKTIPNDLILDRFTHLNESYMD